MFHFSLNRHCPECLSRVIHRSRRQGIIEHYVLPFLLSRPFRCVACDARFYGLFFAVRIKKEISKEQLQGNPAEF
jgi:DNA-directed RNA polymerase subunit RPC12/RpoP